MVIQELLSYGQKILVNKYEKRAIQEAYLLLSHVLNQNKSYLLAHKENQVSTEDEQKYKQYIKSRNKNIPIAYIINKAYFMDIELYIKKGVLIPRQDSEIIIEQLIKIKNKKNVLDMCCGSGVLGISYAHYIKDANITFIDISDISIEVTNKNINLNNLTKRARLIKSNLFENIKDKFDLIISNPPYIKTEDIKTLMDDVKYYEPHIALDGGDDGLYFYRHIIKNAKKYMNTGGHIALEVGINQSSDVVQILIANNYRNIKVYKDYNKIDRLIIANN